jgi:hypothetical protein
LNVLNFEAHNLSTDDLKLFSNWFSTTDKPLTKDGRNEHFWRNAIPLDALLHAALLESILALSALQHAHQSGQDSLK